MKKHYFAVFFLLFFVVFMKSNLFAEGEKDTITILMYPICLSNPEVNKDTIGISDALSTLLKNANPSINIIPKDEIINAMQKAGFAYYDVTGKDILSILKVLPKHDIIINIEPYVKKNKEVKYFVSMLSVRPGVLEAERASYWRCISSSAPCYCGTLRLC